MDLKNFYSITKPIYFVLIALVISSCGTYQYSGNVNDGIYNSNISSENSAVVETKEVNNKANNDYYKSAFRITDYLKLRRSIINLHVRYFMVWSCIFN